MAADDEEELLRSVALQNAQSVLLARQRAEEEILRAKETLELRTAELAHSLAMMRATLESTTDGILATDGEGRVTAFNEQYLRLWRLPGELMEAREHARLLEACSRQFVAPERFLARVEEIYASSPPESYDLLQLIDGRVYERISKIQFVARQNVGRVWSFRDVTERRQAEEARQRLAAVVDSSNDAIISKTLDGVILTWNEGARRIFGYTADEIVGKPITTLLPAERLQEEEEILRRLRRGERVDHFETVRVHKEGRLVDVSVTISPIRDPTGRIVGASKIARDITERRRAEEALHKQSEWLRVTLASIGDAVITTDIDARVTSLNPVAETLTGWTQQEASGVALEECFQIINQESRLPVESPVARVIREGRIVGLANHTVLIARDGFERAISDSAAPIRDNQGHVIGVVLIFRDVTGERKAAAALHRASETSRFLADASAALAELTDHESTLQRIAALAVPAFADCCAVDLQDPDGSVRRLAVHVDSAKSRLLRDLDLHYPRRANDPQGVMKVLRSGEPDWLAVVPDSLVAGAARDEKHLQMLRGLRLKSYICVPLKSGSKTFGALTFATAESGRTFDADDLRAAADLADRAAVAIENASLLVTLKEADQRKDEFLAILAHELRNPLAPIRNAVQILRAKGPPVPELQWARDVIDRQVSQMTRLVDDLLDVSRITRGRIELRKETFELAAVISDAVEASRPAVEKWTHELTVEIPPEPIHLHADRTRVAQILSNLLNNAAKYTEQGGRVWLAAERDGSHVVIRVKDTGVGIPANLLPRVFDLFMQVDHSMERSQGGLGIGLTLVQRLVSMHGGTIEALSPGPGQGTEFVVRLPTHPDASEHAVRPASAKDHGTTVVRCRILVVDDSRDSAESLAMLLEMRGHEVRTAHDGIAAVEAAEVFQPHVVLLDIGLPKLNGYEVARRIRKQRGGRVLLIALTGWGQEGDRRRSTEAGFDHHMTKPVDFDALTQFLNKVDVFGEERSGSKR